MCVHPTRTELMPVACSQFNMKVITPWYMNGTISDSTNINILLTVFFKENSKSRVSWFIGGEII
jgi:hypothetical protein